MRCEDCQGSGLRPHVTTSDCWCQPAYQGVEPVPMIEPGVYQHHPLPCPSCGGSGFAHCCEGERPS
jgi:DnaJ-class molecular chaperone